jgi:hypothetical protein
LNAISSARLPRLLAAITALLMLALAVGLGACGGDGGGEDVDKVLEQTFSGNRKIDSGELSMNLTADLKGVPTVTEPVTVKIGGPFENQGENKVPKLDLDLSANAGGQSFTAGVISTGNKGYINFQGTDYVVPDDVFAQFRSELRKQQRESNTDTPDLATLGVNPRDWLTDPKNEGSEDVEGVETIHISAGVDVPKLLDDLNELLKKTGQLGLTPAQRQQLPSSISDKVKKQITDSVNEATFDLYTGKDDKILRKLDVKLQFDVDEKLRQDTAGVESGSVAFTVQVANINEPQEITAPKNAKPLSDLQSQLEAAGALGALGGSSGGSSGGGSSGGGGGGSGGSSGGANSGGGGGSSGTELGTGGGAAGGSGASTSEQRRYLRCVRAAKSVEDIRKCGTLLGK